MAANEYALYKGEQLLYIGTIKEIAEQKGVLPKSLHFYKTPSYKKRLANRKRTKNYITLVKLEDDEE